MTSGLLLKRLHQRGLCGISHVIVDEVHERDLDNATSREPLKCMDLD